MFDEFNEANEASIREIERERSRKRAQELARKRLHRDYEMLVSYVLTGGSSLPGYDVTEWTRKDRK